MKPENELCLFSVSPIDHDSKTTAPSTDDNCWGSDPTKEDICNLQLSGYPDREFPPKPVRIFSIFLTSITRTQFQDLITTGYVPYGSYVRNYAPSLPQSESQTSLQSASQLAAKNRNSTILNVSDPRYSATYGNSYLRSPPKQSQFSVFPPTEYQASQVPGHSVSLITSPASTSTANSVVSCPRSSLNTPPVLGVDANQLPSVPRFLQDGHNSGSVMGIVPGMGLGSPQLHHRQPASNDLYAFVCKPGTISYTNTSKNVISGVTSMPNTSVDTSIISTQTESSTSPVNYILDSNPSSSETGTHV